MLPVAQGFAAPKTALVRYDGGLIWHDCFRQARPVRFPRASESNLKKKTDGIQRIRRPLVQIYFEKGWACAILRRGK
jgi:hypothetical protein